MNYNLKINVAFKEHVTPKQALQRIADFAAMNDDVVEVTPVEPSKFDLIREWAEAKGILKNGDPKTQTVKLLEEAGELAAAVLRGNKPNAIDAIGDMVVVLTSIAYFSGTTIEDCIEAAYNEIKGRTGKMVGGDFQKEVPNG